MFPRKAKARAAARQPLMYSPRPDLFVGSPRQVMGVVGLTLVLVVTFAFQAFAASPAINREAPSRGAPLY